MEPDVARQICQQFANKHKIVFQDKSECGFGRPCVGFMHGDKYIDFNPLKQTGDFEEIQELHDDKLRPPHEKVPNAYHKHDCMAVLAHPHGEDDQEAYDVAILELAAWVQYYESIGEVEVVRFETGAQGLQVLISGLFGHAIKFKEGAQQNVLTSSGAGTESKS